VICGTLRTVRPARIDIVDDTYIHASPEIVRARFDDPAWVEGIWPHLHREVSRDRGTKGVRWTVTGQLVGDMEIWIEPYRDGVLVHHYVRAMRGPRAPRDVATRHTLRWKRAVHALKDSLEGKSL
jgi:hypothetical protein